jgi:hypothetical protein
MQYFITILSLLANTAVHAVPVLDARVVSAVADIPPWTIGSFTRTCNAADTSCIVSFTINANLGALPSSCTYNVTGTPASQTRTQGLHSGPYMIGSSWSGQFGPGNGFTVVPILDWAKN